MNEYVADYRCKNIYLRATVYAETRYAAQQQAAKQLKARKSCEVWVALRATEVPMGEDGKPTGPGTPVGHCVVD